MSRSTFDDPKDIAAFCEAVATVTNPPPAANGVEVPDINERGDRIVRCSYCDSKSGTLLEISHERDCPHWRRSDIPPFRYYDDDLKDPLVVPSAGPNTGIGMFDSPRAVETGTISFHGATKCIIVAVRDDAAKKVWMVRLNTITGDKMLDKLITFLPSDVPLSVYLCGGDNFGISGKQQTRILKTFESSSLDITYRLIHLGDYANNQLIIDAATGKYFVQPRITVIYGKPANIDDIKSKIANIGGSGWR